MKVVLMSTQGRRGGAARATLRLHNALLAHGVDVNYLVKKTSEGIYRCVGMDAKRPEEVIEKLVQVFYIDTNRSSISDTYFSFDYQNIDVSKSNEVIASDLVNLHWVDKFVGNHTISQLVAMNKPMVWTLHDERPYTGGCHYTAGCRKFEDDCKGCGQLEYDPLMLTRKVLLAKEHALRAANLTVVTPSKWLAAEARKSRLFRGRRIEVIPNSIETLQYKPSCKASAKASLGIPENSVTIMFSAHDTRSRRKGFSYLIEAMRACRDDEMFSELCDHGAVSVITVGASDDVKGLEGFDVYPMGFVDNDDKMTTIYNAADLFVLPSIEDNLPNTVLESMSTGVPVIAFNTGGVPDMITDGVNGMVVKKCDSAALSLAILKLVHDSELRVRLGARARIDAEAMFSQAIQAERYVDLYSSVLNDWHGGADMKLSGISQQETFDDVIGFSYRRSLDSFSDHGAEVDAGRASNAAPVYRKLKSIIKKIVRRQSAGRM